MNSQFPNILLILSDNHPAELLGCYGNQEIHTPNLDRLAQEGTLFNEAFCVNAMCSPCRATLFTGLMPSQHGIHTWLDDRIMDRWPPNWNAVAEWNTLPEILRSNGYNTALIGKYHLGTTNQPQNGFDHWVTFPLGRTRSFWGNTIIDNGREYVYDGHIVDCFTDQAVKYINTHASDHNSEAPFFLYLPYNAPYGHWPSIQGPARNRFAERYAETPMQSIPRGGLSKETITRFVQRAGEGGGGIDYTAHLRMPNDLETLRNYFSQMSMMDDGVGRVLAALDANGLRDNTLVIYSCDHGFSLGHHGFWGHSQATWPSNAHRAAFNIPLLVRHPGRVTAGRVTDRMTSQLDLCTTILDYVGLENTEVNAHSHSKSFAPFLTGRPDALNQLIFMEQEETRAVRTQQWLYMHRFKGHIEYPLADALYDVSNDPKERRNLIDQPAYADIAQSLREEIAEFWGKYTSPKWDLWSGGTVKSNSDKAWFWEDVWGDSWKPGY